MSILGTQHFDLEGVHRRETEIVEREVLNLAPGKVGQSSRLGVLKENKHPGRNPDLAGADVKTSIGFSRISHWKKGI